MERLSLSVTLCILIRLHGPSMLPDKVKICRVLYNQSSSIVLDETSGYWSVTKTC